MNGKPFSSSRRGFSLWVMGAVLGAAAWLSSSASAQSPEAPPAPLPVLTSSDTPATPPAAPEAPHVDPNVVQAGCASCSARSGGCGDRGRRRWLCLRILRWRLHSGPFQLLLWHLQLR